MKISPLSFLQEITKFRYHNMDKQKILSPGSLDDILSLDVGIDIWDKTVYCVNRIRYEADENWTLVHLTLTEDKALAEELFERIQNAG